MTDAEHWLWRLDADGWMRAALTELESGADNVAMRRTAITHARRAAGMALNAVLVAWARAQGTDDALAAAETRWGRSYIDHLRLLGEAPPEGQEPLSPRAAEAARGLIAIPLMPREPLVQLHRSPHEPAQQALHHARALLQACSVVLEGLRTAAL